MIRQRLATNLQCLLACFACHLNSIILFTGSRESSLVRWVCSDQNWRNLNIKRRKFATIQIPKPNGLGRLIFAHLNFLMPSKIDQVLFFKKNSSVGDKFRLLLFWQTAMPLRQTVFFFVKVTKDELGPINLRISTPTTSKMVRYSIVCYSLNTIAPDSNMNKAIFQKINLTRCSDNNSQQRQQKRFLVHLLFDFLLKRVCLV